MYVCIYIYIYIYVKLEEITVMLILQSLCTNSSEESFVMSPVSLHSALALTYFGARGPTAEQMATGLKLTVNKDSLRTGFRQLFMSLKVNA
jgi:serine protease inhibitor